MKSIFRYGTLILLAASISLSFLLSRALAREQAEARRLSEAVIRMKEEMNLAVNQQMPPLRGEDVSGSPMLVTYDETDRPTLFYVFSPTCVWCQRNADNIRVLSQSISEWWRVTGIAMADIPLEDRQKHVDDLGFQIVFSPSSDSIGSYRLGGTPQTLLVSPEGLILKSWSGAYTYGLDNEIEDYFGIELPGIQVGP